VYSTCLLYTLACRLLAPSSCRRRGRFLLCACLLYACSLYACLLYACLLYTCFTVRLLTVLCGSSCASVGADCVQKLLEERGVECEGCVVSLFFVNLNL